MPVILWVSIDASKLSQLSVVLSHFSLKVSENKCYTYVKTVAVDQNWIQNATVFTPCICWLRWNAKIFIFHKRYHIKTQFEEKVKFNLKWYAIGKLG